MVDNTVDIDNMTDEEYEAYLAKQREERKARIEARNAEIKAKQDADDEVLKTKLDYVENYGNTPEQQKNLTTTAKKNMAELEKNKEYIKNIKEGKLSEGDIVRLGTMGTMALVLDPKEKSGYKLMRFDKAGQFKDKLNKLKKDDILWARDNVNNYVIDADTGIYMPANKETKIIKKKPVYTQKTDNAGNLLFNEDGSPQYLTEKKIKLVPTHEFRRDETGRMRTVMTAEKDDDGNIVFEDVPIQKTDDAGKLIYEDVEELRDLTTREKLTPSKFAALRYVNEEAKHKDLLDRYRDMRRGKIGVQLLTPDELKKVDEIKQQLEASKFYVDGVPVELSKWLVSDAEHAQRLAELQKKNAEQSAEKRQQARDTKAKINAILGKKENILEEPENPLLEDMSIENITGIPYAGNARISYGFNKQAIEDNGGYVPVTIRSGSNMVTIPMSFDKIPSFQNKLFKWAGRRNGYTNEVINDSDIQQDKFIRALDKGDFTDTPIGQWLWGLSADTIKGPKMAYSDDPESDFGIMNPLRDKLNFHSDYYTNREAWDNNVKDLIEQAREAGMDLDEYLSMLGEQTNAEGARLKNAFDEAVRGTDTDKKEESLVNWLRWMAKHGPTELSRNKAANTLSMIESGNYRYKDTVGQYEDASINKQRSELGKEYKDTRKMELSGKLKKIKEDYEKLREKKVFYDVAKKAYDREPTDEHKQWLEETKLDFDSLGGIYMYNHLKPYINHTTQTLFGDRLNKVNDIRFVMLPLQDDEGNIFTHPLTGDTFEAPYYMFGGRDDYSDMLKAAELQYKKAKEKKLLDNLSELDREGVLANKTLSRVLKNKSNALLANIAYMKAAENDVELSPEQIAKNEQIIARAEQRKAKEFLKKHGMTSSENTMAKAEAAKLSKEASQELTEDYKESIRHAKKYLENPEMFESMFGVKVPMQYTKKNSKLTTDWLKDLLNIKAFKKIKADTPEDLKKARKKAMVLAVIKALKDM